MRRRLMAFLLSVSMLLTLLGDVTYQVYAEDAAPTEETTETTRNFEENIEKYATFNIEDFAFFALSTEADGEPLIFASDEIPADMVVVITQWYMDELDGIWYKIEAAPGHTMPEELAACPWILDGYVGDESWSLIKYEPAEEGGDNEGGTTGGGDEGSTEGSDVPQTELNETTDGGVVVGISGELPEGIRLSIQDVVVDTAGDGIQGLSVDPAEYGIEDASTILAALDIRLLDAQGTEYQPYEEEKTVLVTIDADKLGQADGDIVRLHHNHEGTITVHEPFVVIGGKLTFWADRFSTYIVEAVRKENKSQQITDGSTYTMKVGERIVFWGDYPGSRAVWQVDDPTNAIDYYIVGLYEDTSSWAQWIEVDAKDQGIATLSFMVNNTPHTFYLEILPQDGLYIDDNIAENGCLVPTWSEDSTVDLSQVRYTWSRDDGQAIHLEAKRNDGSINVSVDRGGAVNLEDGTVKTITYTVVATDLAGNTLGTASFEVIYGNEILNPSFEKPGNLGGGYRYYYNGYPGLYWKTTAPGSASKGNLLQDMEIVHYSGNSHGNSSAAHGNLFAELNAENFGALYQDMLTTPGASLTWEFSHTKRGNTTYANSMYVIVAPTLYAQEIISEQDITKLQQAAVQQAQEQGAVIPQNVAGNPEGFEFTYTDDNGNTGTYRIWKSVATYDAKTPDAWMKVSGTYKVPEGQYLTRLFFSSDTEVGSSTTGNMIDAAYAGEFMSYIVEYYKGDVLQSADTEKGPNRSAYEQITLGNLQKYLDVYKYPFDILINGRPYPGTIENLKSGLLLTDYGSKRGDSADQKYDDYNIVLQIVFQDPNIRVTKIVKIEGWEDMTTEEKKALLDAGITAKFQLSDAKNSQNTRTHTAEITITQISDSGVLTGAASFRTVTEDDFGILFNVTETYATPILNYAVKTEMDSSTVQVTNEQGQRIKNITVTNTYVRNVGNLTIKKDVVNPTAHTAPADDVFTFIVSGEALTRDTYMVSINNQADQAYKVTDGKLTIELKAGQWAVIKNLDLKNYKVEEVPKEHYALTGVTGDAGTIVKENTAHAGFVNTYRPEGDLKIYKFVDRGLATHVDIDETKPFTFVLELVDVPAGVTLPATGTIRDYTGQAADQSVALTWGADNKTTFSLKHNQYIVIEGLPQVKYHLQEASAGAGYDAPFYNIDGVGPETACSGQIPKGKCTVVECYNPIDMINGSLSITKQVNPGDSGLVFANPFEFTVVLRNMGLSVLEKTFAVRYESTKGELVNSGTQDAPDYKFKPAGAEAYVDLPEQVTAVEELDDFVINGVELYDGLTIVIEDLPPCGYEVIETPVEGFTPFWEGKTGSLGDANVTGANPDASVKCVNVYGVATGELNITKTVKKDNARDTVPASKFSFTVEPAADSGIMLDASEYTVTLSQCNQPIDENAATTTVKRVEGENKLLVEISFTEAELKDLGLNDSKFKTLKIQGLPLGSYVVTEAADVNFEQKVTTATANVDGSTVNTNFLNTYKQHMGTITISKTVTGTATTEPVLVKITGGSVSMTIPVIPGTPVTVCDLPLGVTYTVKEITDWNWRYEPDGASFVAVTPTLENPNQSVTFVNTDAGDGDKWLSGTDSEPNTFIKSTP